MATRSFANLGRNARTATAASGITRRSRNPDPDGVIASQVADRIVNNSSAEMRDFFASLGERNRAAAASMRPAPTPTANVGAGIGAMPMPPMPVPAVDPVLASLAGSPSWGAPFGDAPARVPGIGSVLGGVSRQPAMPAWGAPTVDPAVVPNIRMPRMPSLAQQPQASDQELEELLRFLNLLP